MVLSCLLASLPGCSEPAPPSLISSTPSAAQHHHTHSARLPACPRPVWHPAHWAVAALLGCRQLSPKTPAPLPLLPAPCSYDVVRLVRERYPRLMLPVILVSANSREEHVVEGLQVIYVVYEWCVHAARG